MEAKDKKLYNIIGTVGYGYYSDKDLKQYLERQAEITWDIAFKAGQESLIEAHLRSVNTARLDGIKEVVEWVICNICFTSPRDYLDFQSKLEEWGVK